MNRQHYIAAMSVLFLSIMLVGSLMITVWPQGELTQIGLEVLGEGTFELFGLIFVMVGLVMFTAILGGVFIAKEEEDE